MRALDSEMPPYFIGIPFDIDGGWDVENGTGKARRVVGAWPTPESLVDALLARLQEYCCQNMPHRRKLVDGTYQSSSSVRRLRTEHCYVGESALS